MADKSCLFFAHYRINNVETFGFITSPKSFTGTGLGRQLDHGFTSVRPVQPPSSAVGLPVAGYADPSRTSVRHRLAASSATGLPVFGYTDPCHTSLTPV